MARPESSYLLGKATPKIQKAYEDYPEFSFWAKHAASDDEILLIQYYFIEPRCNNIKQAKTKLRNIIRKREDFVRFF